MSEPAAPSAPSLAPLLVANDGSPVTRETWPARRQEILDAIMPVEYGLMPPPAAVSAFPLHSQPRAGYHQDSWMLSFATPKPLQMALDLYLPDAPAAHDAPRPVVVCGDGCWQYARDQLQLIIRRGYALALFNRLELAADVIDDARYDRFAYGLYRACPGTDCGALAAWAWGYHRVLDFLATRPEIDMARVALSGHSRGGKTVLIAAATDPRPALVNPNGSGCGGSASYHYCAPGGETMADVLGRFPFWFARGFDRFLAEDLPFDQHFLTALIAPRWLIDTQAADDHWANLPGQALIQEATAEVYRLLGAPERLSRHVRPGTHFQRDEDFEAMLDVADRAFGPSPYRVEAPRP